MSLKCLCFMTPDNKHSWKPKTKSNRATHCFIPSPKFQTAFLHKCECVLEENNLT